MHDEAGASSRGKPIYLCYMFDNFVRVHINTNFQEPIIEAWNRYREDRL